MRKLFITAMCLSMSLTVEAEEKPGSAIPDLTKGGELTRINERWAGPLGIYCGMWRARQRSDDQLYIRQLLVQSIDKGSPADGVLFEGDVILGADGSGAEKVPLFEGADWTMIPIAEAITEAEARDPALLQLLIWRPIQEAQEIPGSKEQGSGKPSSLDDLLDLDEPDSGKDDTLDGFQPIPLEKPAEPKAGGKIKGKTLTVTIKLEPLGRYSKTAPYDCPKSKRILRKGIQALYEANQADKSGFGVLCLLAADDPTNPDNAKYQDKAKEWVHQLEPGGSPWFSGPKLMALSEYYMKTRDEAIFPKLVEQAEYHARGVSWFGTSGHRWCEKQPDGSDNGRIAGYGPITCSGALGFLGLSLARKAGVRSPAVEASHKAQRIFFGHYAFRGGMGYGEHPYGIGGNGGDYNGKAAMSALALGMEADQEDKAKFFTRGATLATYSIRQYAHGGSYFGQVWHPIGSLQGGVKAANLQFREIRWHLDLKRRWDHTRIYDSSGNGYGDFSHAATALIFYAAPLKQLYITGRGQKESLQFSDAEFEEILETRNFDPTQSTNNELLAALPRCQGMLRSRAGNELARRVKEEPDSPEWPLLVDQLLAMTADKNLKPTGRAGACYTLMKIKDRSRDSVATMKNAEIGAGMVELLKDPDAYIRFAGVRVLQKLDPESVRPHVNGILDAVIATGRPTFPLNEEDPLQWAHGEMGDLLFNRVLSKSIDGVDRTKLIPAIRSLLQTPNGGARSASTRVLSKLTREEALEVADVLVDNIQVPPPGNSMFAGQAVSNSQSALAQHMFEEALPLSAAYGPEDAIKNKIPEKFGKAALNLESANDFLQSIGDQILIQAIDAQGVVEGIEKGAMPEKLYKLKRIYGIAAKGSTLKLPAVQTELEVDAKNFGRRGENETTYTWHKVYGPGKVRFSPNSSGQSKKTTLTFTDRKPGTYRFEVAMSDTLGLNVLRKTVDVTLYDPNGKLPGNRPPQAISQSLKAVPGFPVSVNLSGTDPDGDDLGFIITRQPSHGKLSGVGGELIYTANFGNPLPSPPKKLGSPALDQPTLKQPSIDDDLDLLLGDGDPLIERKPDNPTDEGPSNWTDSFTFEAIDGQGERAKGTVSFEISDRNVGVVVYEGFDYPQGALEGLGGGTSFGFSGTWKNTRGTKEWYMVTDKSLSYKDFPSTGNKLVKGKGWWPCSRRLDRGTLSAHKLLDNGQELWFSVIVQGGQGKFHCGLTGKGTSVGFLINQTSIHAAINGEPMGTTRTGWSRSPQVRFPKNSPNMIIGRCMWGKTDEDLDTVEIYRVFEAPGIGPMVLEKPVGVMQEMIPQADLHSFYMTDTTEALDEIRIGKTLHSVLLGTKPLAVKGN